GAGNGLTGSPFVRAFAIVGIPYAAGIMNAVVITAALSSCNTDLYLTTRMFFSLSRSRYLPAWIGTLSKSGVPGRALLLSSAGMGAAILLAIYAPAKAFLALYGIAVAGMFFVWTVILVTHLAFRRALGAERVAQLPMRLGLYPFSTVGAIVGMLGITAATFFVPGLEITVPAFSLFLAALTVAFWVIRGPVRHPRASDT